MPEYSDIYVLSDKREKEFIERFLDHFLPSRVESADEYEVPQYADHPEIIFQTASELIRYGSEKPDLAYAIYWKAAGDSKPEHGMIFFLNDGNVICGLSTDASNKEYASDLFQQMKMFLKSSLGYIAHEASPDVTNATEFQQQMEAQKS